MYVFIPSFNKYLLSTYCVPSTALFIYFLVFFYLKKGFGRAVQHMIS